MKRRIVKASKRKTRFRANAFEECARAFKWTMWTMCQASSRWRCVMTKKKQQCTVRFVRRAKSDAPSQTRQVTPHVLNFPRPVEREARPMGAIDAIRVWSWRFHYGATERPLVMERNRTAAAPRRSRYIA